MSTKPETIRLDLARPERTGFVEAVYSPGKTDAELIEIVGRFSAAGQTALVTRIGAESAATLQSHFDAGVYHERARLWQLGVPKTSPAGEVAVLCAGTADVSVAEEAALTLEAEGRRVSRYYDVGVAGLHRVLNVIADIRRADVVIVVAGMDGALPSVVTGLVHAPVVAVPTSVGYGAAFQGLAPLLTMLNACAEGLVVVNIDNGFGAARAAARMVTTATASR